MSDDFNFTIDDEPGFTLDEDQPQDKPQAKAVPVNSNVEEDVEKELSDILQGFKGRADKENQRILDATDSEYWVAVCFQTREQKEEFLKKIGVDMETMGDKYIDGMELAKIMGIKLESRVPAMPRYRAFDTEYVNMAMDLPE
jgi:hypothetical protein